MAPSQSLTQFLLSHPSTSDLYIPATQSPFLRLAGQGKLPLDILSHWLSQDRLYAQAYIRFIGGLISRVSLPVRFDGEASKSISTIEWRILKLLSSALDGIMTEVQFFETTAGKYGIDLQSTSGFSEEDGSSTIFHPNKVTSEYINLFDSFHDSTPESKSMRSEPKSLLEGMVLLWATEKVYHEAWRFAKSHTSHDDKDHTADLDGGALNKEFIPNWTSKDFAAFVEEIEACLNELAARKERTDEIALRVWRQVLELERGFWPAVES